MEKYISVIKSKLAKSCAIMHRSSFVTDKDGMLILYHSLLLPYITYYIEEVWGNMYVNSLTCRANRLDHISSLCSKLRILKLPHIVDLRIALIMYNATYTNCLLCAIPFMQLERAQFFLTFCPYQSKENVSFN